MQISLFVLVISVIPFGAIGARKHYADNELAAYLAVINKHWRRNKAQELMKSPLYKEDHQDPLPPGLALLQHLYRVGSRSAPTYAAMSSPNKTCDDSVSCYPKLGSLLIGRESLITASSTCGLNGTDDYCYPFSDDDCFQCDSRSDSYLYSHRVTKAIPKRKWQPVATAQRTWWQSKPGDENVTLQIDFETRFSFWMLTMQSKYAHPGGLILQHSNDFGKTWKTDIYYSTHCKKDFPHIHEVNFFTDINDVWKHSVICSQADRRVATWGTSTAFRANKWNPRARHQFEEVTNIRLNFTRFPSIIGKNGSVQTHPDASEYAFKRRYYTIYHLDIKGRCFCNGHADECVPFTPTNTSMAKLAGAEVHGKCKCLHNTAGDNCSECKPGFFLPDGKSISDSRPCKKCVCDTEGTLIQSGEPLCVNVSNLEENLEAGQCQCKQFVSGYHCDECNYGYHNLNATNPDGCEKQVVQIY